MESTSKSIILHLNRHKLLQPKSILPANSRPPCCKSKHSFPQFLPGHSEQLASVRPGNARSTCTFQFDKKTEVCWEQTKNCLMKTHQNCCQNRPSSPRVHVILSCIELASAAPSLPHPSCSLPLTDSQVFSPSMRENTSQYVSLFEAHKRLSSLCCIFQSNNSFFKYTISPNQSHLGVHEAFGALLGNWLDSNQPAEGLLKLNVWSKQGDLIHYNKSVIVAGCLDKSCSCEYFSTLNNTEYVPIVVFVTLKGCQQTLLITMMVVLPVKHA